MPSTVLNEGAAIFSAYNPLYSLAGFLVGVLIGMTGVGGGSLMTPLLVLLFGFHPATAVGTDLLYASVTKSVGTAVHGKRETVDWQIVGALASGSVPAAIVTLCAHGLFRGERRARRIPPQRAARQRAARHQHRRLLPAVDPALGRPSYRRDGGARG